MNQFNSYEELNDYCGRLGEPKCRQCEAFVDNLDVCDPSDSNKTTFEKLLLKKRKQKLEKLLA